MGDAGSGGGELEARRQPRCRSTPGDPPGGSRQDRGDRQPGGWSIGRRDGRLRRLPFLLRPPSPSPYRPAAPTPPARAGWAPPKARGAPLIRLSGVAVGLGPRCGVVTWSGVEVRGVGCGGAVAGEKCDRKCDSVPLRGFWGVPEGVR